MNSTQSPLPLQPWPPLITGARLPLWIRIRDIVLTLLAWILLAWLIRDSIYVVYDYMRPPIFELSTATLPDLGIIWERLRYFVFISIALILALALTAVIDRHRLLAATRTPQPALLTTAEQAARVGIEEKIVQEARRSQQHRRILLPNRFANELLSTER
jgi:hypothetical protein